MYHRVRIPLPPDSECQKTLNLNSEPLVACLGSFGCDNSEIDLIHVAVSTL